jgi:hypothetical protein
MVQSPLPRFVDIYVRSRAALTFRGAHGVLSARGPPPPPPNDILNTEYGNIKKILKYSFAFPELKSCLCNVFTKKKEICINN